MAHVDESWKLVLSERLCERLVIEKFDFSENVSKNEFII